ncbi:MAG TPA: tRNA-uridine aminocarboxypropyltransferase [Polyangiaceae bacterium]|nr:tRNA-uridine aminocarboxypropyltransferase [Polyangiaceae bacterium]
MTPEARSPEAAPRAVCARCERPSRVCLCRHLTPLATRTRVLLLQHPRERRKAIGTAKLAHLCLPDSELRVGVCFEDDPVVRARIADPARPALLLYPGPGAGSLESLRAAGPRTLVVLDGTWPQSKILLRENPSLARLPRYAFTPPAPSEYRIRREPAPNFVSTLESLALALALLEGEPGADDRFRALYAPFRAMVDVQLEHQAERPAPRRKRPRFKSRAARLFPELEAARASGDLVCVAAEANAWPYAARASAAHYPDELVHLVAVRLSTGERLDRVVRPQNPLAPSTEAHTALSRAELERGEPLADLATAWEGFLRPGDTVCAWGRFSLELLARATGVAPALTLDLRAAAKRAVNGKVGAIDAFLASFEGDLPEVEPAGRARAGRRSAQALEVVKRLLAGLDEA